MSKPWKTEPRGSQLEAFVGAFGVHTSQFSTTGELIWFACKLFEIDPEGVLTTAAAAAQIEALGRKERSTRAKRTRGYLFPNEDFAQGREAKAASAESDPLVTEESLQLMMDASTPQIEDGLDLDPAKLLQKVVSAVISAGHASDLYEFPDVLTFFGAKLPTGNLPPL